MTAIRVMKNTNYTVMCNYHLKDTSISLKAKGLLSMILSLPEGWRMSVEGLVQICLESETAVKSGLAELKKAGYLTVHKIMPGDSESGRIEYEYIFREIPDRAEQDMENQGVVCTEQGGENQGVEIQAVENVPQLNKDNKIKIIYNTPYNPPSTSSQGDYSPACEEPCPERSDATPAKKQKGRKPEKHKYGEHRNVLLSDKELDALKEQYPEDYLQKIEALSRYIWERRKKYADHYRTLIKWLREDADKPKDRGGGRNNKQLELSSFDTDEFYEAAIKHSYGL